MRFEGSHYIAVAYLTIVYKINDRMIYRQWQIIMLRRIRQNAWEYAKIAKENILEV